MEKKSHEFKPYIASTTHASEFTLRAMVIGVVLGLIFGVGNTYLGLKVGTTVSASIPAAVMSMAIMSAFFKKASILESNMVQTVASVGEGLAAGVIFTAPALFLIGEPPSIARMMMLSVLGAILGILFMIPMRRYIIVEEHGKLPFPEGTACAEILKSKASETTNALIALLGIVSGSIYKILCSALNVWKEVPAWTFAKLNKMQFSMDCTPALLGVGYIVGARISSLLLFGGILAWWVLIPLIVMFGEGGALIYPGKIPVSQMGPDEIWSSYIRFIGAGAVGIGGIFNLFKIIPVIKKTLKHGVKELFEQGNEKKNIPRVEKDISLKWLILGSVAIVLFLWLFPCLPMNFLTIILLVIIGFFFVAVTSITVGIVGSTSNPGSGMTISTLLITCLIFLALGWTDKMYLISALTMSIVVNVAITLASTTSQDLKTGFLLGATPRSQQLGEIIGTILPAIAVGATLYLLNNAYGFGSKQLPAPQASLMELVAKGVLTKDIPFVLVFIGAVIGGLLALVGLPILPVAIGLYLPLSLSTGMAFGGIISWVAKKFKNEQAYDRGVLASSGLIAGDACTGVVIAFLIVFTGLDTDKAALLPQEISFSMYVLLAAALLLICKKGLFGRKNT
jgi:putative OPT family oligopeptide transporter